MKKGRTLPFLYCAVLALTVLTVHWGSRAVTIIAERTPIPRAHTVIIDAGHGGVDGGATSCTGMLEKEFNLQISLRLRDLAHLLGLQTRMIRTEDISVYTEGETIAKKKVSDLKQRLRITEETPGAILVSIHQNTFSDGRYFGPQVFYGSAQSQQMAETLQRNLTSALAPGSNRQCKKAQGVWLMEKIQCPGVLIECGFLSNPEEEAKLRSADYQQKLCAVIACCLSETLSNT